MNTLMPFLHLTAQNWTFVVSNLAKFCMFLFIDAKEALNGVGMIILNKNALSNTETAYPDKGSALV